MEPQDRPLGAPERLDVPFELKTVETVTQDDGVQVGIFEGLASTFGNRHRRPLPSSWGMTVRSRL